MPMPCVTPNCGNHSFAPVQVACGVPTYTLGSRPQCPIPYYRGHGQQPQIIEEIVYVNGNQNRGPAGGGYYGQGPSVGCACQGMQGCGCHQAMAPLTIINTAAPPVWATDNYHPRWQPVNFNAFAMIPPPQPRYFRLPVMNNQPTSPAERQFDPRGTGELPVQYPLETPPHISFGNR